MQPERPNESKLKEASRRLKGMMRKTKVQWLREHGVQVVALCTDDAWLDATIQENGGDPKEIEDQVFSELTRRIRNGTT